jgi:hypothetical protein
LHAALPRGVASLLLFVALGAGGGSAQENPPTAPPKIDPKAQALLDRAIQALGGPAFLGFKTLTTRGRVYSIVEGATVGMAPFELAVQYPDKRRYRLGDKQPVILVNDGDRAWELDRMGTTFQLPRQLRPWKLTVLYGLENLLRLRIREPGTLIQAGGTDFVDNVPAQAIDIFDAAGTHIRLLLHRQTYLPVRISYRVQDPKTREWEEYADVYGDYHSFQGIQTPMHIVRYLNGERISETFRTSARYDEVYPPDYFAPSS